ncbi:MAG TPA: 3-hydroxybutyryl-CoA dehydrogenase [Devosia sp.]|nr:3-hydroxybutyryl-CoA dehydrogenase [Devosia sp.]
MNPTTDEATPAQIVTVGVIGAGQMGSGIAHVLALAGYDVVLNDLDPKSLERALTTIGSNLDRTIRKGTITVADKEQALTRIATTTVVADFAKCQLIIEAATEDEAIKRKIFAGIAPHIAAGTILATNTSSISVTRMAATTPDPSRFVGMHFMNPVPVMTFVEIIRGAATSDATVAAVVAVSDRLGKVNALVEDSPAFLVNRLLIPMLNEAIFALAEGVASVEAIDTAMRLGANHPMGPLMLADYIGLDTCLSIMRILQREFGDQKYRPCPLLVKYVDAGWLGRKTGRGFYDYSGEAPVPAR